MKYFITLFVLLFLSGGGISCSTDEPELSLSTEPSSTKPPPDTSNNDNNNSDNSMTNRLKITIGNTSFCLILEDNAAAKAYKAQLPLTVNMSELNGNEKYFSLSTGLSTASINPGTIRTGDLMLYGSTTVVLFYKTFSTSYSYTRLGRVDNPSGLASALGSGSVRVKFELQ